MIQRSWMLLWKNKKEGDGRNGKEDEDVLQEVSGVKG